ncbi:hypothetical protein QEH52_05025 [Coraliomargarita sp. SDUM461003]|uniref:HTH marR-type domain-containing protein n=1 Tax=Thalassobacterium maritimum TaxID=3041265 RepID=A0ABU1AUD6_9BACT|nr:hypothetical protein [Coraliomargarita sp. SDUM461003]MDQ8206859.1 hypothetical protein [Coraliomargarita sp. SDUM461003]
MRPAYLLADTNNTSIKVAKNSGTDRVDLGRSEKTPLEKLPETSERVKVENEVESKVETPVQILRLLEENPKFTLRQVAVEIEKSISLVEKTTAKLVKEGKLRHVGPKKNGKWEVLK